LYCKVVDHGLAVSAPIEKLDLKKRDVGVEYDRTAGTREPDIDEERPKPTVGFYDSLETVIAGGARKICQTSREDTPAGLGLHK
jgi:hypothetical protein